MGPRAAGPWQRTPWRLDAARHGGPLLSAAAAVGGRLSLRHDGTGQKLVVPFAFYSVGVGHGAVLNDALCCATGSAESDTCARVRPGREFGPDAFPCLGYFVNLGMEPRQPLPAAIDRAFFLFGFPTPFGGIDVTGWFSMALRSAGSMMGGVAFSEGVVRGGR